MVPFLATTPMANHATAGIPSVVITDNRRRFADLLMAAHAAVVWCPRADAGTDEFYVWLRAICGLNPLNEIICIAAFDPESARALGPVPCADVIWEHELSVLKLRLVELETPDPSLTLERFVAAVSSCCEICGTAIQRLCDLSQTPLRKVEKFLLYLGGNTDYERRARWHKCFHNIPPKEVIDWVLLIRGLTLAAVNGMGPIGVAVKLGVHERTMDRISIRLTDLSFAEAKKPEGLRAVVVAFYARLNSILMSPNAAGATGRTHINANGAQGAKHSRCGPVPSLLKSA